MEDVVSQNRTLEDLEWPQVCQAIARRTSSDLGRAEALALSPCADAELADMRLTVMREVLLLQSAGAVIPAPMFRDVGSAVELTRRGGAASAPDLRELGKMVSAAVQLDRFGEQHEEQAPHLGRVLAVDQGLGHVARAISDAIDDDGSVRDDASPELARARAALRTTRAQVQKRVEELISRYREALQDGYFAERDGRYVLPVRADAPFRVEGIVLGTSASGSTLYVEPTELGQLGNKLRLLELDVETEEARVLLRLSAEIAPHADEILWAQGVCVRGDLLRACGSFASEIGAVVVPFDEPGGLLVKDARHPLLTLAGVDVVPSDLRMSPGRALVLSGPNAGGKTIAMKTLGLLALLQATGLPVPVHPESKIGFFDEVLSDIGDDQSLSMSLSSFSGHVRRVRQVLDEAGHGTMVLFDELMSGTDPDEGAVLAIATVEALLDSGASVCVTTHYEPLKQHAAVDERLENGAVGFDFERMEPTFRVEMGRPGASSALIVAERHGLWKTITERALALLPEEVAKKRSESLSLEEQALAVSQERELLHRARSEQELLNRKLAIELEKAKEARRRDLGRESDALRNEVREARAQLRSVRQALKGADAVQLSRLEKSLDTAANVVALGGRVDRDLRSPSTDEKSRLGEDDVQVGLRVKIAGFQEWGKVLQEPRKGQVQVLVGVMKMSVPLASLELVEDDRKTAVASPRKVAKQERRLETPLVRVAPVRSQDVTLDLRGRRVEEGLLELDHFVDELLRSQESGGFVLHGHGTGAMKEAVRAHLRGHACVVDARPAERDEGGDAFTVFWLN